MCIVARWGSLESDRPKAEVPVSPIIKSPG
jgi:hypothetical protein